MAHLLVIDNEPVFLNLISSSLRHDGHNVIALEEPTDVLRLLLEEHAQVDLLITGLVMKPFSGFELLKRLNRAAVDVPVLFTSDSSALSTLVASGLGGRAILEKPFTSVQLRNAVARALGKNKPLAPRAA
jgi:two-component system sensor histidine kinase ChiS